MAKYEVRVDFEPIYVQVEIEGEFDMIKILNEVDKLDEDGHIYHNDRWVGLVQDEKGNKKYDFKP